MKRRLMTLVLLSGIFSVIAYAQHEHAQPKQPAPPMSGMGMMRGQMGPGGGPMALPGMTPEQRTKMQDLRLAHQKEMLPLHTQLQKLQADVKLELTADKVNEGKVKSLQSEISKLTSDIAGKQFAHMRGMRDLLTAEQKKVFDERVLSGNQGPGGKRGPGAMMGPGGMKGRGGMMGRRGMMGHGGMGGMKDGPKADCPCQKM